jgi:hypothetical protein
MAPKYGAIRINSIQRNFCVVLRSFDLTVSNIANGMIRKSAMTAKAIMTVSHSPMLIFSNVQIIAIKFN